MKPPKELKWGRNGTTRNYKTFLCCMTVVFGFPQWSVIILNIFYGLNIFCITEHLKSSKLAGVSRYMYSLYMFFSLRLNKLHFIKMNS